MLVVIGDQTGQPARRGLHPHVDRGRDLGSWALVPGVVLLYPIHHCDPYFAWTGGTMGTFLSIGWSCRAMCINIDLDRFVEIICFCLGQIYY